MKLTAVMAAMGLALAMLSGCGDSGTGGGSPKPEGGKETPTTPSSAATTGAGIPTGAGGSGKPQIAVIPKGTTHEFWKSIHAGAVKAMNESAAGHRNGPLVELIWRGPLTENDSEAQIKVVEDMINMHVAAIVLAPNDANALKNVVEEAAAKRIPVTIIDSEVNSEKYKSFVATDNEKGGYMGGQQLATLLGGKGKVALLRYQEGSASTDNREAGFLKAMKENPAIEVVSSNQYAGATSDSAFTAAERLLAPYRNADGSLALDGIFTPNESSTFGMLRALQEMKLAGKIKFVGFDASETLVKALADGQINALVLQNPMKMGYLGVKTAIDTIKEKRVEKRIDTGVQLITKENMNDPDNKDLLTPDLDKWLK